jgi:hypothetical protein
MKTIPETDNLSTLIEHLNEVLNDIYRQIDKGKSLGGIHKMHGPLDMNFNRVINVPDLPKGQSDAITRAQAHGHININTGGVLYHNLLLNLLWSVAEHIMDDTLDMNSNKVTEISEIQMDANAKVYWGDPANNNFFFITNPPDTLNFMSTM